MPGLRIATVQLIVTNDPSVNRAAIVHYIEAAHAAGARVVLFPECALTGYPGYQSLEAHAIDWNCVQGELAQVQSAAKRCGVWVLVGAARITPEVRGRLRNSLLVVNPVGEIVSVYDKRRLYGRDETVFSAGEQPTVIVIGGVTCGLLICFDSCFPELYREYRALGVTVLFHSFYNAGNTGGATAMDGLILAQQTTRAADFGFWIAASNCSTPHSRLAAGFFGPDGSVEQLAKNVPGIRCKDVPPTEIGWTYFQHI